MGIPRWHGRRPGAARSRRGAVDGPVDATPAGQTPVGCIDHGIHLLGRDVAPGDLEAGGHRPQEPELVPDVAVDVAGAGRNAPAPSATCSPQWVKVTEPETVSDLAPGLVTCLSGNGVPDAAT